MRADTLARRQEELRTRHQRQQEREHIAQQRQIELLREGLRRKLERLELRDLERNRRSPEYIPSAEEVLMQRMKARERMRRIRGTPPERWKVFEGARPLVRLDRNDALASRPGFMSSGGLGKVWRNDEQSTSSAGLKKAA